VLELQLAIEKAKADIAKAKRDQIQNQWSDSATAEESKKKAQAQKDELGAKLPATEAKALAGTVGVEGIKLLALPPILQELEIRSKLICAELTGPVFPFEKTVADGIASAFVMREQLGFLINAHRTATSPQAPDTAARIAPALALGAMTTVVKATADFASLFKTNVVTGKQDLTDAKVLFLTMLAGNCKEKILFVPGGYVGELDLRKFHELNDSVTDLLKARYGTDRVNEDKKSELARGKVAEKTTQEQITALEKKGGGSSDEEKRELVALRNLLQQRAATNQNLVRQTSALDDLIKQTDAFLQGLKASDPAGSGPLLAAARFLGLADLTGDPAVKVLDIDVKAEGVTVLKDGLFTGQRLRITGAAIISYRLMNKSGRIERAQVIPVRADFVQLELR